MASKGIVEIAVAKLSLKQGIIVAVIGLFAAVAVTIIPNFYKVGGATGVNGEVSGFYSGRATAVEQSFREIEEEIQEKREAALNAGKTMTVTLLNRVEADVRASKARFRELHTKHLDAVRNEKQLAASEIRLEANQTIIEVNEELYGARGRRHKYSEVLIFSHSHSIPLYGGGNSISRSTAQFGL